MTQTLILIGLGLLPILVVLVLFFVMLERLNIIISHIKRTSVTTQKLLEEIKDAKKDVTEIKRLLIHHYNQPEQENPPPDDNLLDV